MLDQVVLTLAAHPVCPDFSLARDPAPLLGSIAADFHGSGFSFEEKLLIASGVRSKASLAFHAERLHAAIDGAVSRAKTQVGEGAPDGHWAWARREALHQGPCKTYREADSDLRSLLETGRFNCLTGTAMYWIAASRQGLVVSAYLMRGHVLPMVRLGEETFLIEATDPREAPLGLHSLAADSYEKLHDQAFMSRKVREIEAQVRRFMREGRPWAAAKLAEITARFEESVRREGTRRERIRRGLAVMDEPALAALFLNNLMVESLEPAEQLRLFVGMLELFQQSRASSRLDELLWRLGWIVDLLCEAHGYDCAVDALGYMIHHNHHPALDQRLRTLRAQLFDAWVSLSPGDQQDQALHRANLTDPDHPVVVQLRQSRGYPD
jgi:hypothetical protein